MEDSGTRTTFKFLKWQDLYNHEKPFQIYIEIPPDSPDQRRHNLVFEDGEETIVHDVRGREAQFTLDTTGFTYLKHVTKIPENRFRDRKYLEEAYLPECEELIRQKVDNIDQVYIFDWRVRYSDLREYEGKMVDYNNPTQPVGPATHVHVDQSDEAALRRVLLHLPDQADDLLKGRLRIINIWRPIGGPVQQWPLAVCDGRTVQAKNMIETDHVRRQYAGCTLYALKDPGMKWYYMKDQRDDEVLMFKNFDSQPGVAKYAPHSSFPPSNPSDEALRPRGSVEVRALVFTHAAGVST